MPVAECAVPVIAAVHGGGAAPLRLRAVRRAVRPTPRGRRRPPRSLLSTGNDDEVYRIARLLVGYLADGSRSHPTRGEKCGRFAEDNVAQADGLISPLPAVAVITIPVLPPAR
jgi:hypothetical protein